MRFRIPFITTIAAAALSGCAYGDYGYGGVGVGLGYGNGYYGANYGPYGGYGAYPGYYGGLGYGWYDDYYYPGTGYYVYDSYRRPHRWTDRQRSYWSSRQHGAITMSGTRTASSTTISTEPNWSAFERRDRTDRRTNHPR
ncbi:hypothetical protein GCM10022276_00250 [Sphingomonas limnosediminicola]|uniref:Vitellogenin II n=1 Tax=Sphingomonas limnosediminicola TaxID=940133 RepID=A0ABP7KT44_9SPHN